MIQCMAQFILFCMKYVLGDQFSVLFDFSAAFDILHSLILDYFLYLI